MNTSHVISTVVVDLKQFFREKTSIFFVLLFPILLILLFGFIFQGQGDVTYSMPVQDLDGGEHASLLLGLMNESGIFDIDDVDPAIDPHDYLVDNDANIILIIPNGYSTDVNQSLVARAMGEPMNRTVNLTVIYDETSTAAMTKIQILASLVDGMNKGYANITDIVDIEAESAVSGEFEYIEFFVPGIIAMTVMTSSLFGTVGMTTEMRQKGILRKLGTTPLTRPEWLISNILYQFVMALMSTIVILLVGFLVFGLVPHITIFMLVFIILDVFAFGGIGMLIARFVKEAESAQAAANAVMFPMMFLSGTFFPLEMMPGFLQTIAKFLPLYYVNEGLRASMISLDTGTIIDSAVVILVFAMAVFVLGVFLTSWKED